MVRRLISHFGVGDLVSRFKEDHRHADSLRRYRSWQTTFHLGLGDNGKVLLKKKFSQKQLITFTANLRRRSSRWRHVLERIFWAVRCVHRATM
jgi:hypothetical protein